MPTKKQFQQKIEEIINSQSKPPTNGTVGEPTPNFSQETIKRDKLTLLRVPEMKELPPRSTEGRPSYLETLAHDMPDLYAEMIHNIRRGSYYHVAAEAIGINSSTFKRWLKIGGIDIVHGRDSLYHRLYLDCRVAVACARLAIEQAYAALNPAKWLAHGPGRIFGDQWREPQLGSSRSGGEVEERQLDSVGEELQDQEEKEQKQITQDKSDEGMMILKISPADELATLEAQEIAGHIQVSDEYKESLRRQIQKDQ